MKGDLWFGHTCLANKLGTQGVRDVLQIKTGHALFPAKFLDEELAEAPGGCWITMTGKGPRETNLLAIGYKYNSKRVLKFVATTDDGSTKAGTPYDMRFTDAYINVCVHKVQRPTIISTFFNDYNCVDSHNHVHNYELALGKKWLTQDPFFRLDTTCTDMTVADVWKLASFHKFISNAKDEEGKPVIIINKFSGKLARQLINIIYNLVICFICAYTFNEDSNLNSRRDIHNARRRGLKTLPNLVTRSEGGGKATTVITTVVKTHGGY
jgi:hypothetical protein